MGMWLQSYMKDEGAKVYKKEGDIQEVERCLCFFSLDARVQPNR